MKYYNLKPAVDTKETGSAFPAAISYENYDFNKNESIHNLQNHRSPSFAPDLRFTLAKGAKLTDLISDMTFKSAGLLVSKYLLNFISESNTIPFEVFPVFIKNQKEIKEYYRVHFVWETWYEFVDWDKSNFELFENGTFTSIKLNDYSAYENEVSKSEYFRVGCRKAIIKPIPFDIFNHPFIGETLVTERLYNKIKINSFTGLNLTKYEKI